MDNVLQPLRIAPGWTVDYNQFRAPDLSRADGWMDLKGNLLQMRHEQRDRLLDLGWVPEGEPKGSYLLRVFERDFTGTLLREVSTPELPAVVAAIERALEEVTRGAL